jgi:transmembrane 9 superfamily protein 2/4
LTLAARSAWYLPGVAPHDFEAGDVVELHVNKLTSVKTQLPFEYYHLPYCRPANINKHVRGVNLGEVLSGDDIRHSPYELKFRRGQTCAAVCTKHYDEDSAGRFVEMIDDEYRVHWVLDNLPVAVNEYEEANLDEVHVSRGFPVGFKLADKAGMVSHYLYNHVRITISYNTDDAAEAAELKRLTTRQANNGGLHEISTAGGAGGAAAVADTARIVGFEIEPFSVRHSSLPGHSAARPCGDGAVTHDPKNYQPIDGAVAVAFTYDTVYAKSEVKWANRWDIFLISGADEQVHWFSILNSLMIVLFLTGMVAMIMVRTLHRDIARYNALAAAEEGGGGGGGRGGGGRKAGGGGGGHDDLDEEETGWKLVHGDVFRAPAAFPSTLATVVGTGVQVVAMTVFTLTFALLGFLSPANRGGLLTAFLLLFVLCGGLAGYHGARFYKMFGGKNWKLNTVATALAFPGSVFLIFFVLNLFVWGTGSSGAVPFLTLVALVLMWLGISTPLVFVGAYFGLKAPTIATPTRVNVIARTVPEQLWYMQPLYVVLAGGILPFGAVFIELFFIMSSIWLHQVYYLFGFLVMVLLILAVTCAEVSVVMCYFQLSGEDYDWWWRSFLTAASTGLYLMVYSVFYFYTKLEITYFVSVILYFGYMLLASIAFAFLTGTFGFFACFWFVRKIYGSIKVD